VYDLEHYILCGRNLVSHFAVENVREWGAGEDVWLEEGRDKRGVEKSYDLYCSSSTIWMIKSRIMKQTGAFGKYVGQGRCLQGFDGKT